MSTTPGRIIVPIVTLIILWLPPGSNWDQKNSTILRKRFSQRLTPAWLPLLTKNLKFNQQLTDALSNNVSEKADDCWNFLRDTIYSSAIETYGKKEHKNTDWFEANITEMEPVIKAKRVALIKYKDNPSQSNLPSPVTYLLIKRSTYTLQKHPLRCQSSAKRSGTTTN